MKSKILLIVLPILASIAIILGIIILNKNIKLENNKIEIIDATFNCMGNEEKFYEDNTYIYSFPCVQSSSIYVKFPNGNKMLVKKALEDEKVTIDELLKAGLKVSKKEK